jgi:hypothetical protein
MLTESFKILHRAVEVGRIRKIGIWRKNSYEKRTVMFKWFFGIISLAFIVPGCSHAHQFVEGEPSERLSTMGHNLKTAPAGRSIPPAGLGVDL